MRIVHASGVIEIDELEAACLAEDESDGQQQQTAHGQRDIAVLHPRPANRQTVMRAVDHSWFRTRLFLRWGTNRHRNFPPKDEAGQKKHP